MCLGSGIRDPGSGKKPILEPGVEMAPDPGSATVDTAMKTVHHLNVKVNSASRNSTSIKKQKR
jgi:hypothetical protein